MCKRKPQPDIIETHGRRQQNTQSDVQLQNNAQVRLMNCWGTIKHTYTHNSNRTRPNKPTVKCLTVKSSVCAVVCVCYIVHCGLTVCLTATGRSIVNGNEVLSELNTSFASMP